MPFACFFVQNPLLIGCFSNRFTSGSFPPLEFMEVFGSGLADLFTFMSSYFMIALLSLAVT